VSRGDITLRPPRPPGAWSHHARRSPQMGSVVSRLIPPDGEDTTEWMNSAWSPMVPAVHERDEDLDGGRLYDVEVSLNSQTTYRKLALRIIHHELGHYVVARAVGFRTDGISVTITKADDYRAEAGIVPAEAIKSVDAATKYLRRRIKVLYGGVIAETLPTDNPGLALNNQQALNIIADPRKGAAYDYAKVRELCHVLRGMEYPDSDPTDAAKVQAEYNSIEPKLWNEAYVIVEQYAGAIKSVTQAIFSRLKHPGFKLELSESDMNAFPELHVIISQ
jgi:hypothetical protein